MTPTRHDHDQGALGQAAPAEPPTTRRHVLRSGGAAALASLLGVVGLASVTSAKNGEPLRVGDKSSATKPTQLESSKGPALQVKISGSGEGVGVRGSASSAKGVGVQGEATSEKGTSIGVQGTVESPEGIAGQFVAKGGGSAVEALASEKDGVALRTKGRLELGGRSGIASVSGGAEFVIPVAGGLSERSLVLATLQEHFPGVHVESASVLDAEGGLVVVRLNQAVPEPAKVGWLVLD